MSIQVRRATSLDARQMSELLNGIIQEGGTTAMTRPVAGSDLVEWMESAPGRSVWHVAIDSSGEVVGFQWIEPASYLPAEAANIASFVQVGRGGLGIGSALFEQTRAAAKAMGYIWINATIRADNESGLTYYQSRGFRDYDRIEDYELDNGLVVDKLLKRFDLD